MLLKSKDFFGLRDMSAEDISYILGTAETMKYIMKRIALLMGLAVIALSSCTKDSVKEINTGHAIDFRVSAQTRASEITTGNLQTFYVTALNESGVTYFEDLAFIRSANDVFISTPSYFWPTTGSLSFYAYAPSANELNGTLEISSTTKTITDFSPAGTIADQKDFVVAKATGNKAANQAGVFLEFGHMLSQVEVHAKNLHDGYTYLGRCMEKPRYEGSSVHHRGST